MEWEGSPKQIEYAKNIVAKFAAEIECLIEECEQLLASGEPLVDGVDFNAEIAKYRSGLARLHRIRSARWILDKARVQGAEWTVCYLADPNNKLII